MAEKTCPTCEKPFPRLIARGRNRRYCCEACRREMHNRRRRLKRGSVPRSGRPAKATPKKPKSTLDNVQGGLAPTGNAPKGNQNAKKGGKENEVGNANFVSSPAGARASCTWSPDEWATWVRGRYEIDASEHVLLSLMVDVLRLARDEGQDARVRLAAAGRFQSLLRQLGLEAAEEEEARHGASSPNVVRFAEGRP